MAKKHSVYDTKKPYYKNIRYVGVEIEFSCPVDDQVLGEALEGAGLSRYVNLGEDGSVDPTEDGEYPMELRILAKESEYINIVQRVCNVLYSYGANVNKTCGLHVHLDCRSKCTVNPDVDPVGCDCGDCDLKEAYIESTGCTKKCKKNCAVRDRKIAYYNIMSAQDILYKMQPESRRKNSYCKITKGRRLSAKKLAVADHRDGISIDSLKWHSTIEVRVHTGSVNATKINNWIGILLAIANAPKFRTPITGPRALVKATGMSDVLASHMRDRIAKFNTVLDKEDIAVAA